MKHRNHLRPVSRNPGAIWIPLPVPRRGVVPLPVPRRRPPVPVVDPQRCTGCGICRQVCAAEAIEVDEVASIDAQACISCTACVQECPEQALSLPPHS
jgi:ferredoxin